MAEALQTTLAGKAAVLEGLPDHPAVKAILRLEPRLLLKMLV